MVAESEDLVLDVAAACAVGAVVFLITFVDIVCRRHIKDPTEVPNVRSLIKCQRLVTLGFILLLLPLFWEAAGGRHPVITPMTSYGSGSSWNFGWGRPSMHFALAFVGAFLDSHPVARLMGVAGMAQALFLDTMSSYDLGTQIDCVESGRCALPDGHNLWDLWLLNVRDLISIALATWMLLLVGYLGLVIGTCRSRYNFRQLHAGDHNRVAVMRKELAKRNTRTRHLRDDDSNL